MLCDVYCTTASWPRPTAENNYLCHKKYQFFCVYSQNNLLRYVEESVDLWSFDAFVCAKCCLGPRLAVVYDAFEK